MATDGQRVYATVSDVGRTRQTNMTTILAAYILDPKQGGGLTALKVTDGSKDWHVDATPCAADAPQAVAPRNPERDLDSRCGVRPPPPTATSARIPPRMESSCGTSTPCAISKPVNGVKGKGGAIDGPGAVVVNGMVFISSGYRATAAFPERAVWPLRPEPAGPT